jgi:hypothetical protein
MERDTVPRYWREQGCTVVVFEGTYSSEAALASIDAALRDGEPAVGLLLDLTDSLSFRERSADGLRRVVQFLAARRDRFSSRLATVGSTDLAFGLLRMGMVFAADQGLENEAFRSRDEALAWLDCDR